MDFFNLKSVKNIAVKLLKYIFVFVFSYIIIFFSIYIISGFLLINGITSNQKLIKHYQRNFYLNIGLRDIWHAHKECIAFDEDLIFIPKETSCEFKNFEYDTVLTFDKYGRYSDHPLEKGPGIAVLGDSHAMGWGVNDHETFSAILESKINKPVYNLAVSGYGTIRKLIRFEKSGIANMVDTVVIQYTYNDWGENNNYKKNTPEEAKNKFEIIGNSKPMSFLKKLRKSFRYSLTIPIDAITNKNQIMDFDPHKQKLNEIIKSFPILNGKRLILFYSNGYDMKFGNFPSKKSDIIKNLEFADLDLGEEHFFQIDGHLSKYGHKIVAEKLSKLLIK